VEIHNENTNTVTVKRALHGNPTYYNNKMEMTFRFDMRTTTFRRILHKHCTNNKHAAWSSATQHCSSERKRKICNMQIRPHLKRQGKLIPILN
jgi:hypothetical protein